MPVGFLIQEVVCLKINPSINHIMKLNLSFALIFLIGACNVRTSDLQAQLRGRWAMDQVIDSGQDVTDQHNPAGNRYIIIKPDGTFESGGDPHGVNTGSWTLSLENGELYLDSDAGEGDDSYWIVTMEEDSMHWKGTRSEFTERFELIHKRDG
jgi:hypothetical protein